MQLHIRQEDFAIYLGISRSLLSLHEKGLRSLPTQALIKLSNLDTLYDQARQKKLSANEYKSVHPEIKKHDEKVKKDFQLKRHICSYKINQLERRLNEMIDKHTKAKAWDDLLTVLLDSSFSRKPNKERHFLEVQKQKVFKKLIRFGSASQAKLHIQIEILKAEEQANKKWGDII